MTDLRVLVPRTVPTNHPNQVQQDSIPSEDTPPPPPPEEPLEPTKSEEDNQTRPMDENSVCVSSHHYQTLHTLDICNEDKKPHHPIIHLTLVMDGLPPDVETFHSILLQWMQGIAHLTLTSNSKDVEQEVWREVQSVLNPSLLSNGHFFVTMRERERERKRNGGWEGGGLFVFILPPAPPTTKALSKDVFWKELSSLQSLKRGGEGKVTVQNGSLSPLSATDLRDLILPMEVLHGDDTQSVEVEPWSNLRSLCITKPGCALVNDTTNAGSRCPRYCQPTNRYGL